MRNLGEILLLSTEHLKRSGIPSARLDVELILSHALGLSRVQVYLAHERPLEEQELAQIRALVRRRASREPLAHVLGRKEFLGLEFMLRPGLLVPRPDSECLVEAVEARLPTSDGLFYVADIGCGTGCLGLSLATRRPEIRLYATDLNPVALECTRENAVRLGIKERVAVLRGDLVAAVPLERPIDWLISNPPYIPTQEVDMLAPEIRRFEDRRALDGGVDGLDVFRRLLPAAARRARLGVAVEVGQGQASSVGHLMEDAGLVHSMPSRSSPTYRAPREAHV
jgi:release factor glutamine methyltransferase